MAPHWLSKGYYHKSMHITKKKVFPLSILQYTTHLNQQSGKEHAHVDVNNSIFSLQ
jgi:hypothetical protein